MSEPPTFSLAAAIEELGVAANAGKLRVVDADFVKRMQTRLARRVGRPIEEVLSFGQRRILVNLWQRYD